MRLGISGLEDQAQALDPSRAYLVACSSEQDAVNIALGALHASAGGAVPERLFLYGVEGADLRGMCAVPNLVAKSRARVCASRTEDLAPAVLSAEILRSRRTPPICVCLSLRGGAFLHLDDPARAREILEEAKELAATLKSAILLVVKASGALLPVMREAASTLAGFAQLGRHDGRASLLVDHWEGASGGCAQLEIAIECGASGFAVQGGRAGAPQGAPDAQSFYICGDSFTPDQAWYSDIRRFKSEQECFDAALGGATAATVVLQLHERSEADSVARMAYELRQRRGSALSIIVWERTGGLRADTEKFIVACGASFVFESGAAATYVSAMLPCFRLKACPVPRESFEAIRRRYHQADAVAPGVKTSLEFIDEAEGMLSKLDAALIPCTLAVLLPKRGMPASLAARNFLPRRGGDICAAFSDSLWIFLPSCRPTEAPVALRHAFSAPLDSMFGGVSLSGSASETRERLESLRSRGSADVKMHGIGELSKKAARRAAPGIRAAEDLTPLSLEGGGRRILEELSRAGDELNRKEA
jgi:hypothetical protein